MSTFTVPPTVATFATTIRGSRQEAGDVQRLTLGVVFADEAEWQTLLNLTTTKYHVHSPIGGNIVIDVVRGPGQGTLDVDGLGAGAAVLITLERPTYLPFDRTMGSAVFLVLGSLT